VASNLDIVPDSVEYSVGSAHLVQDGNYFITIDGTKFPPRYSPAFSLMLAPSYLIFGHDEIGNGIYIVTAFALIGIMAAYAIGYAVSGCPGGVLAAGFMLLLSDYLELGRRIMADVPGAALSLLLCWLYLHMSRRQQYGNSLVFASGCVIALASGLRPALLVMVLPFMLHLSRRKVSGLLYMLLPIAAVIGLTLLYNDRTFGSLFRNGYNFWCPVPYDFVNLTLSPSYLKDNLKTLLSTPALPSMITTGLCMVLLRKLDLIEKSTALVMKEISYFILFASSPYLVFHLLYFYQSTRFFLPITCLFAAVTGGVVGRFFIRKTYNYAAIIFSAALLVFAFAQNITSPPLVLWRRAMADAVAKFTPDDAVIIAATDPGYLGYLVAERSHRIIIPLNRNVEYASKLIAARKISAIEPSPDGWWDHRAAGLINAGATEAVRVVAVDRPDVVAMYLNSGRRVFLLQDMTTQEDLNEAEKFIKNYRTSESAPGIFELRQKNGGN